MDRMYSICQCPANHCECGAGELYPRDQADEHLNDIMNIGFAACDAGITSPDELTAKLKMYGEMVEWIQSFVGDNFCECHGNLRCPSCTARDILQRAGIKGKE